MLRWSEAEFWVSTPHALSAGIAFHNELHGDDKSKREREYREWQKKLEAGEVTDVPEFVKGKWVTKGERVKGV